MIERALVNGRSNAALLALIMSFFAYQSTQMGSFFGAALCALAALLNVAGAFHQHEAVKEYRASQQGSEKREIEP